MNVIARESTDGELFLAPHDVMTADNGPLLLTHVQRHIPVVLRYTRVERWDIADGRRIRRWRGSTRFALAAIAGIGMGAIAAMVLGGVPGAKPDARAASVVVPPAVAEAVPPVRAASRPPVVPSRAPAIAARRVAAVVAPAMIADAASAAALEPALPDSESAALARAFSTNEAVSWRGPTTMGTVVVGAASIERGRYCRDVAILTRADNAADRTVNVRKCLEPGGRIEDQAPSVPQ